MRKIYERTNPERDGTYHYVEIRVPSEDELAAGFQSTMEGLLELATTPDLIALVLAVQVRRLLGYEVIIDGLDEREEE